MHSSSQIKCPFIIRNPNPQIRFNPFKSHSPFFARLFQKVYLILQRKPINRSRAFFSDGIGNTTMPLKNKT